MKKTPRRRTKTDLEKLVRELLPQAKNALEDRGGFAPFGAAMLVDGEIQRIDAETEEAIPGEQILAELDDRLRGGASNGDFRATVTLVNVRVRRPDGDPRDAVQVKLDHAAGASLELFFPYRLKRPGVATFGRAFSRDGNCRIFD